MKISHSCLFLALVFLISCQPVSDDILPTSAQPVIINRTIPAIVPVSVENTEVLASPTDTIALIPTLTTMPLPSQMSPQPEDTAIPERIEPTLIASTTPTIEPGPTVTPTATMEPTATFWPTVTRQILAKADSAGLSSCQTRSVSDDLLFVVTQQFPLPEFYVPPDLVLLIDYFGSGLTLDQALYTRQIVIEPLSRMIAEMNEAGLRPSIISAYRSAPEQAMAWKWWQSQYPGRVAIMSARPGYSEHQLGTTLDFGSPELNHLFHVDFANTVEGMWLADNAHRFGFTLSYPLDSYEITGFKYEPWHYRYVGVEMAQTLFDSGQILTSWQKENVPPPCIP